MFSSWRLKERKRFESDWMVGGGGTQRKKKV